MKWFAVLVLFAPVYGQAPANEELATRMAQLMESTAVVVPGLVQASQPLQQNAAKTVAALKTGTNPASMFLFMNQVKAYLALSDSMPRPSVFPQTADQQYAELREDLQRMQRQFEGVLQKENTAVQAVHADPSDLKRYADENSKLPPPGKLPRVVFLGDSAIDAWRLNEYFIGRDFINRGIGGQTTIQMLSRFVQDVLALHPKAVLITGGAEDIARGISVSAVQDDLAMMGDLAKAHGIKPLFASILPAKQAAPAIQQINVWLKDYCARESFVYVDFYSAMADANGLLQADLSDDGLHPSSKGYRIMSPIALEAIGRAVTETEVKRRGVLK